MIIVTSCNISSCQVKFLVIWPNNGWTGTLSFLKSQSCIGLFVNPDGTTAYFSCLTEWCEKNRFSANHADCPLFICKLVCIKETTDSIGELNKESKLYSNHTVNNNERQNCSLHTCTGIPCSVHGAFIWRYIIKHIFTTHSFILFFYCLFRSIPLS